MSHSALVYQARNLVNGERYIGYTARPFSVREAAHRHRANGKGNKYKLHHAIAKYGQENFVFEVIATFGDDEELAKVFECEAIAAWRPEYNLSYGGEGGTLATSTREKISAANTGRPRSAETVAKHRAKVIGRKHTEETKVKIALANTGRPGGMKGKAVSAETRAKLSAANKGRAPWTAGRQHTAATKQKMSAWQVGRKLPSETRAKISAARVALSKTPSESMLRAWATNIAAAKQARQIRVLCVEDGLEFAGCSDADRHYGFPIGTVSRILKGTKENRTGKQFRRVGVA